MTFDTTGSIGNYPIEAATAPGGADAIFVMGYDYRNASSSPVGSVAPLGRTGYDIRDTVVAYTVARPGVEGDPRRPVLRPGLVDGQRSPQRDEHELAEDRRLDEGHLRHRRRLPRPVRPEVRRRARGSPGPPTGARTARRPMAA